MCVYVLKRNAESHLRSNLLPFVAPAHAKVAVISCSLRKISYVYLCIKWRRVFYCDVMIILNALCLYVFSSCRERRAVHSGPGEVWGKLCLQRWSWPGFSFPQVLCIHQRAHSTLQKPGELICVYRGVDGVRRAGGKFSWDTERFPTGAIIVFLSLGASVLSNTYSELKHGPSGT